ncbi:MAG: hypothetical protein QXO30_01930 [Candidatus Caldarchaeum sp.]
MTELADDKRALSKAAEICSEMIPFPTDDMEMRDAVVELALRVWLALANLANVLNDLGLRLVTKVDGEISGIITREGLPKHLDSLHLDTDIQGDQSKISFIKQFCKSPYKLRIDDIELAKKLAQNGLADLYITPPGLPIDIRLSIYEKNDKLGNIEPLKERIGSLRNVLNNLTDVSLQAWITEAVNRVENRIRHYELLGKTDRCPQCGGLLRRYPLDVATFKGESGEVISCTECGYRERLSG